MPNIHILGPEFSSFLRSVRLYCEELGIKYSFGTEFKGQTIALRSQELAKLHPFKKVPVLLYGDTPIFETTTICRFLDTLSSKQSPIPADPLLQAYVDEWAGALSLYVDDILIRQYVLEFAFPKGPNNTVRQEIVQSVIPKVKEVLLLVDQQLGKNLFFCGDFYSMADAILTPMLDYTQRMPHADEIFSQTQYLLPYLTRMKERPSAKVVFNK